MSRSGAVRHAALAAVVLVLLVLVVAQLILPGIAAHRLRDRLGRSGTVLHVAVHAVPAVTLLWHHADSVDVRLGDYRATPGHLSDLVDEAAGVGSLHATAQVLTSGLLTLRDATLVKQDRRLTGTGRILDSDLRSVVPGLDSVVPVASSGGGLVLRGTASLLGLSATVDATVRAAGGRLLVAPDVPFGGLATLVLFADPRVSVDRVRATPLAGGFRVSVAATVRP